MSFSDKTRDQESPADQSSQDHAPAELGAVRRVDHWVRGMENNALYADANEPMLRDASRAKGSVRNRLAGSYARQCGDCCLNVE